jgi:hypothetical protein
MHTSFADYLTARRRFGVVAAGLSALAVAGAGTGLAQASAVHARSAAHGRQAGVSAQILDIKSTMRKRGHRDSSSAGLTIMKQYADSKSGVSYLLLDQLASRGDAPNYISWESDTPASGNKRSVEQVDVDATNKYYSDSTAMLSAAPAPEFGVQSSADQVKQAIQKGMATKDGTTTYDGQKVLELKVSPQDKTERDIDLYVDPSSYAPAAETKTYTSGGDTFDYQAKFVDVTSSAVSQLETKPAEPAGYTGSNG